MEIKKVFITGHTSGIGKFLCGYFQNKKVFVCGASRNCTPGFDHKYLSEERIDINDIDQLLNSAFKFSPDLFINNAYSGFQQSRILLSLSKAWKDSRKIVLNISSNASDFSYSELDKFAFNEYDISKLSLDKQSRKSQFACSELKIINFRPGLVNTPRVEQSVSPKLEKEQFIELTESVLKLLEKGIYIQELTFSPIDQFKK